MRAGEIFEDVRQARLVEVDVAWGGVFGLFVLLLGKRAAISYVENIPFFQALVFPFLRDVGSEVNCNCNRLLQLST